MKTRKRIKMTAHILAILLLLSTASIILSSCGASANLSYESNGDGTCVLTKCNSMASGEIVIPETNRDGEKVVAIADEAFRACKKVKSVVVPEGVTTIGKNIFYLGGPLESLTLPSTLEKVGEKAFYSDNIYRLYISDLAAWCKIEFEGTGHGGNFEMYLNNQKLTEVTIPETVTEIKAYAFSGVKGLAKVTVPNHVTAIGKKAFFLCTNLSEIALGNGITKIDEGAFYKCESLTEITIPDSVITLGKEVLAFCSSLKRATLGSGLQDIGSPIFEDTYELTEVIYCGTETRWAQIKPDYIAKARHTTFIDLEEFRCTGGK